MVAEFDSVAQIFKMVRATHHFEYFILPCL